MLRIIPPARALLALVCIACVSPAGLVRAAPLNRAGVVVRFDDGAVESRCVEFAEESATGADLLARSGLKVLVDSSSGLGITVCKIEDLGCDYPSSACFCQCMGGGTCRYWNYYYREPGGDEWVYSPVGALQRKVSPGSVEAWVWGDGHTPPGADVTFEAICQSATTMPGDTATAQAAGSGMGSEQPAGPTSVPPSTSMPSSPGPAPSPSVYWPFGLMILILIGVAAYFRLGRK